MKLCDLIRYIEKIAPLGVAAPWDNSGMQVASERQEITHVAMMLDPTPEAVRKALAIGADCLLSHHPLAIKPRLPNVADSFHAVMRLLFTHDAPLYSAHTSLDANLHGPAAWLAEEFSLTNRRCLEQTALHEAGDPHYGFGIVGDLPQPLSYAAFSDKLAAALSKPVWRASGPKPEIVARLAYCPGSGESMINDAALLQADVYVTGDVKYHAALETPIRVLDVGHFILEEVMMRTFAEQLRVVCKSVAVTFIEADDPFTCEGTA